MALQLTRRLSTFVPRREDRHGKLVFAAHDTLVRTIHGMKPCLGSDSICALLLA